MPHPRSHIQYPGRGGGGGHIVTLHPRTNPSANESSKVGGKGSMTGEAGMPYDRVTRLVGVVMLATCLCGRFKRAHGVLFANAECSVASCGARRAGPKAMKWAVLNAWAVLKCTPPTSQMMDCLPRTETFPPQIYYGCYLVHRHSSLGQTRHFSISLLVCIPCVCRHRSHSSLHSLVHSLLLSSYTPRKVWIGWLCRCDNCPTFTHLCSDAMASRRRKAGSSHPSSSNLEHLGSAKRMEEGMVMPAVFSSVHLYSIRCTYSACGCMYHSTIDPAFSILSQAPLSIPSLSTFTTIPARDSQPSRSLWVSFVNKACSAHCSSRLRFIRFLLGLLDQTARRLGTG
jgi:hypothetical protein